MKATGIVRRIDDLGRVVIPKEIRRNLRIREGDPLEIFVDRDGSVILKKYSPIGELANFAREYADAINDATGRSVLISDRDSIIAVAGAPRREVLDKAVSPELERVMEGRQIYQHKSAQSPMALCAQDGRFVVGVAAPILSEGDVLGCVVLAGSEETPEVGEVEYKLVQAVAGFLGRHMES